MTTWVENWRIAIDSLRANWFRAVLTAIGIVIGVSALIAVTAVSAGARKEVADSIRRLGGNVVKVDGEFISIGTRQSATDRTITPDDVAKIEQLPAVNAVAPHQAIESLTVAAGEEQTITWLEGVTDQYSVVQNQRARRGRLISATDVAFGRNVIVLGLVVSANLFPGENPVGEKIRIGSRQFEVIGVQDRRGSLADENLDNRVFIPLPIMTKVMLGGSNVVHVDVRVDNESDIEPTISRMEDLLRENHKLPDTYPDDFSVEDQAEIVKEAQRATQTFRILTFSLGGIALLVGGVGIMNMMLVSVQQRFREIGIRKSVGAGPRTVRAQFLTEAVVLSTLGGIAGVIAGILTTRSISGFAGWETIIGAPSVVAAFAAALAVGLFFGYYPARRAAQLDPIAAIRYE
jgi:putative ABC transport system permease protein